MSIEGVTQSVKAAMEAVHANVLCEDDLLQRTCLCGVRHPVGHLRRSVRDDDRHQSTSQSHGLVRSADCCGCCLSWDVGPDERAWRVHQKAETTNDHTGCTAG
jgi:hypothetical protein